MQALLTRRSAELTAAGVTVLGRRAIQSDPLLGQLRSMHKASLRGLLGAWPIARQPGRTVVVSEENLLGPMPGHRGAGFYPGHARAIRAMERLGRIFDVAVRWIVRRQDRFLESVWAFRVGRGLALDFDAFAAPLADSLHWLPIARVLATARLDAQVAIFESLVATRTEAAIEELLGLPPCPGGPSGLRRRNVGLRGPALAVVLHLNRHAKAPSGPRRRLVEALRPFSKALPARADLDVALERAGWPAGRALVDAALAFAASRPPLGFDRSGRRALLARYESGNRALGRMSIVRGDRALWDDPVISSSA